MNQRAALAIGALTGAAAALFLGRRRTPPRVESRSPADKAGEDLRKEFAEARRAEVDEGDFDAAGMGAETIVAEEPLPGEPPPENEFEAMRRRVHDEARAAADEMRRSDA